MLDDLTTEAINENSAAIDSLSIKADLAEDDAVAALPPQLQQFVREFDLSGALDVSAAGSVDANDLSSNSLSLLVELTEGNFASGEYQLPVSRLVLEATLQSMVAEVTRLDVETLGGTVRVTDARADLSVPEMPVAAEWTIDGLQLREALRTGGGENPRMAGNVSGGGRMESSLIDFLSSIDGDGIVSITEGRLTSGPVLSSLLAVANIAGTVRGRDPRYTDSLKSEFIIQPAGLDLQSLELSLPVAKFNGTGLLGFDGGIDLRMRGGAVEKIPVVGDLAGRVTGRLVEYRVTKEPGGRVSVRVNPLGIGG